MLVDVDQSNIYGLTGITFPNSGSLMAYIIFNNKEKPIPKILTIDTTYTYLAEENQKMEVSLYINHKHHPLNDKHSYQFLYLSDQDETKKLEVELLDIKKNHYENYLNEENLIAMGATVVFNELAKLKYESYEYYNDIEGKLKLEKETK